MTYGKAPLSTLSARRKVEFVIGFWASLALILGPIRDYLA